MTGYLLKLLDVIRDQQCHAISDVAADWHLLMALH